MANTVFKCQAPQARQPLGAPHHPQQPHLYAGQGGSSSISNHNQNNSNQNSIFVLNAETNITPNSCSKYYLDFNDNSVDSSASPSTLLPTAANGGSSAAGGTTASSVWSSASSTVCSPAAHAIQKLFNCSSSSGGGGGRGNGSSSFRHHGNYAGIDSKHFKMPKSELLKKKSKFWQYLEREALYEGMEAQPGQAKSGGSGGGSESGAGSSRKPKSKYWSRSYANDNQKSSSQAGSDLSELLEYSCSLCDNCRCMDCQIGYFDCDNSDDSNSEYSFHMGGYEEDEDIERGMELKTSVAAATTTRSSQCSRLECQDSLLPGLQLGRLDNKHSSQSEHHTPRHAGARGAIDHLAAAESCHQCYGLEVEQHCLDFHSLYSDCGARNH